MTGGIDFFDVPPAKTAAAVPLTCNFTIQQQAPKLRIDKTVESVEGGSGDTITVTYRVTATNDGTIAGTTGRLTPKRGLYNSVAGRYALEGAAFAIYDNEALTGTPVSTSDGESQFVTAPLETGKTYWLVETRAPAGHVLLPRAVPFHIEVGSDASASTVNTTDFGAALLGLAGACGWARRRSA